MKLCYLKKLEIVPRPDFGKKNDKILFIMIWQCFVELARLLRLVSEWNIETSDEKKTIYFTMSGRG